MSEVGNEQTSELVCAMAAKLESMAGITFAGAKKTVTLNDFAGAKSHLAKVIQELFVPHEQFTPSEVAFGALSALRRELARRELGFQAAVAELVGEILEHLIAKPPDTIRDLLTTLATSDDESRGRYRGVLILGDRASRKKLRKRFVPSDHIKLTKLKLAGAGVTVVLGTAGTGKTDAMLTADSCNDCIVVYVRAADMPRKNLKGIAAHLGAFVRTQVVTALEAAKPSEPIKDVNVAQLTEGSVRIVIDDAGGYAKLMHAVVSNQDAIREELRKPERLHLADDVSVGIVIGGTGNTVPTAHPGQQLDYKVWDMDDVANEVQGGFLAQFSNAGWLRAHTKASGMGVSERLEVLAMLKNARLGAIIVSTQSVSTDQHLEAIAKYREVDAMYLDTANTLNTLATALAITVGGFSTISDAALQRSLVTELGVLRHHGQPDGADRFEIPDAYRALYLRRTFRTADRDGAQSSTLERLLWRQLAALAPCVTQQHSLWDLLMIVNNEYLRAAPGIVAPASPFAGRTSQLAGCVVEYDEAAMGNANAPHWQLHLVHATAQFPFAGAVAVGNMLEKRKLDEKFDDDAASHALLKKRVHSACKFQKPKCRWLLPGAKPDVRGHFPRGDTVVLLNADKAPCADVIAMDTRDNRQEMIGVAAKLYPRADIGWTAHADELSKWGDLTEKEHRAAKFVNLCHRANSLAQTRHLTFVVQTSARTAEAKTSKLGPSVAFARVQSGAAAARYTPLYPLFVDIDALCA